MKLLSEILYIVHVIALTLAAGTALVKLLMAIKCKRNYSFYTDYFKWAKMLSLLIITGMILLTLSGITWIIIGYPLVKLLIVKMILVGGIWIIGPIIDKRAEPQIKKLIPAHGDEPSPAFTQAQQQHLLLEIAATLLMYVALVLGMLL